MNLIIHWGLQWGRLLKWSLILMRRNPVSPDRHYGEFWFHCWDSWVKANHEKSVVFLLFQTSHYFTPIPNSDQKCLDLLSSTLPVSYPQAQYFPVVQLLLPSRTILALVCEENSLKRDWNGKRNKIMFLVWNRNITITVLIWERERILGEQSIGVPADVFIFTPKAGNASPFLSNPTVPENSRSTGFSRDGGDLRPWLSCTF